MLDHPRHALASGSEPIEPSGHALEVSAIVAVERSLTPGRAPYVRCWGLPVLEHADAPRRGDRFATRADVELAQNRRDVVVDGAR